MAEISEYTLPNVGAYKIIDLAIAKKLISVPDNSKNLFRLNGACYVETSPDGKTNTASLIELWNTWIVRQPPPLPPRRRIGASAPGSGGGRAKESGTELSFHLFHSAPRPTHWP